MNRLNYKVAAVCFFLLLNSQLSAIKFIKNYTRKGPFSQSGYIKDIAVFSGFAYFATSNGLMIFDFKNGNWSNLNKNNSRIPSNYISTIAIDNYNKSIWLGTDSGIVRYSPSVAQEVNKWRVYTKKDGLPDNEITAIAVDQEYVWVGTRYWGVTRFDKKLNRWRPKPYTPLDGLGSTRIYDLVVDGKNIWAGTDDGLSLFDRYTDLWTTFNAKQGLSAKQVTCIDSDGKGIWAGTYGGGLNYFDKETYKFKVYRTADGLADDTVFTVKCDGNHVWIGTFGGVSRFDKTVDSNNWRTLNRNNLKIVDNTITAIALDGNKIWFGSDGEGVSLLDKLTPQAEITGKTEYLQPGLAGIYVSIKDAYSIRSIKLGYRASIYNNSPLNNSGLKILNENDIIGKKEINNFKLATWEIKGLKEGFVYDIVLEVQNSRGEKNSFVYPFVVDNTPPVLNLQSLPESVKSKELFIRGSYLELQLKQAEYSLNDGPFQRISDVNRKRRDFRQKINLRKGENRIRIRLEDIGRHVVTGSKTVLLDEVGPDIILSQNRTNFISADPVYKLNATINEMNLSLVYLNPGKVNLQIVSATNNRYIVKTDLQLQKKTNKFVLVAVDKSGIRNEKKFSVIYNTAAPRIDFDDKLPSKTGSPFYDVKGRWEDKDLLQITIDPGNVTATIDKTNNSFIARIQLNEGFNAVKATAVDEEGNSNTKILQVIYEKGFTRKVSPEDSLKDAKKNYQLYLDYKKKYDQLLVKYQKLLKEIEWLKYEIKHGTKSQVNRPYGPFIPPGNSIFTVKYDRAAGDTMKKIALNYLGNSSAAAIIARFNNDHSRQFFSAAKTLALPNKNLLSHIFNASDQAQTMLTVDILSEIYHRYGKSGSIYQFRVNLLKFVKQRNMLKSSQGNIAIHLKSGHSLLIVRGGSFNFRSNQLKRLMVAQNNKIGYIVFLRKNYLQLFRVEK